MISAKNWVVKEELSLLHTEKQSRVSTSLNWRKVICGLMVRAFSCVSPLRNCCIVRLDNERTHVVYYKKSWLIDRDLDLEGSARLEAEEKMRQAALESGVLVQAGEYGQLFFENWFYSMGFTTVQVVVD